MRHDCFAWSGELVNEDGILYFTNEKCTALNKNQCAKCNFYKHRDTVVRHEFNIEHTKIVEWLPK